MIFALYKNSFDFKTIGMYPSQQAFSKLLRVLSVPPKSLHASNRSFFRRAQ
jgi:hypothetical protein